MACIYTEDDDEPVVEICVLGRLTQHDMDDILPKLEAFIALHGSIRLIEVVRKFDGVDPGIILEGLKFDYRHLRHVTHAAVVSDIGWIGVLTRAASMIMPVKIRTFPLSEWDRARAWIHTADSDAKPRSPLTSGSD